MKKEYAFNKYNLAHLGVCDEFFALYQSVREIYDDAAEKVKKENPSRPMNIAKLERECSSKLRKLLDIFLIEHTSLFTDKYVKIHPNATALKRMQLLDVKTKGLLHTEISIVSFSEFLKSFQDFVCDILAQRESYERPNISWDYVWNNLNEHIKRLSGEEIKETIRKNVSDKAKGFVVYRNLNSISCNRDEHNVVADKITVAAIDKDYSVVLPIHRCKDCNKLFVGYETLKVYEKEYGQLFIIKTKEVGEKGIVYLFKSESPLHKAGYNVIAGMMTEEQRRALLTTFLKTETFSHFEICRDIENAIKIFDGQARYVNAVSKWKSDLMFIGEFAKEEMMGSENQ